LNRRPDCKSEKKLSLSRFQEKWYPEDVHSYILRG